MRWEATSLQRQILDFHDLTSTQQASERKRYAWFAVGA